MKLFLLRLTLLSCLVCLIGLTPQPTQAQDACSELQVVFVVDQSGSMFGPPVANNASDPDQFRVFGTRRAVEILSALHYQRFGQATIKVAALDFGDSLAERLPWTELTAGNEAEHLAKMAELAPAFAERLPEESLGNTNFIAALQGAASLFTQVAPNPGGCPKRAVILLTDGQPAGPSVPDVPQHFAQLQQYIAQFMAPPDHQIYVLGIDEANRYWDGVRPFWEQITGDPARAVRVGSPQDLSVELLEIANQITSGLQVAGGDVAPQCIQTPDLPVPPFTRQLQFTLIKNDPDADILRLFDPSGQEVTNLTRTGQQDPIETITVNAPAPGMWRIETSLPPSALSACQIQLLAFSASPELTPPPGELVPYRRVPLELRVLDSGGGDLPVYSDPRFALSTSAQATDAAGTSTPITMTQVGNAYRYQGELLPTSSGTITVSATGTTSNLDGSPLAIFDRPLAAYEVLTVTLGVTTPLATTLPQYGETPLQLAILAQGQPVTVDLDVQVEALLTGPDGVAQSIPMTLSDGLYLGAFRPIQPGVTTLSYAATVTTPDGPQSIPGATVTLDVYPATRVQLRVTEPSDASFTATDLFLRPTGLPLEVALSDEAGTSLGLGELGVADVTSLLRVTISDEAGAVITDGLRLVQTGSPGRLRLAENTLGPGSYVITLAPDAPLGRGYVWSERAYTTNLRGQFNYLAFLALAGIVALIALIVLAVVRLVRASRNPLTGYLEIYSERQSLLEDGETVRQVVLRRTLPRRNKAVVTASTGLLGLLERTFNLDLSRKRTNPVRRIVVMSPSEADAKAGVADVKISFRDRTIRTARVGPSQPPYSLGMGYFLVKGPRRDDFGAAAFDLADTFAPSETRR